LVPCYAYDDGSVGWLETDRGQLVSERIRTIRALTKGSDLVGRGSAYTVIDRADLLSRRYIKKIRYVRI
jgi:hypothetical protein